ncbi:MAG: hypothetical protein P4L87_00640 [Formivibrio sp.]|nr:hypothetical protein [Formivibrio sp.]
MLRDDFVDLVCYFSAIFLFASHPKDFFHTVCSMRILAGQNGFRAVTLELKNTHKKEREHGRSDVGAPVAQTGNGIGSGWGAW